MRLFLVLLVHAHLLLRGAAMPHAHESLAEAPGHSNRAHVHVSGHDHRHPHAHGHHRDGNSVQRSHRHSHDDEATDHLASGTPVHEPSPDHDRDAVYLDDDGPILVTGGPTSPRHATACWLALPAFNAEITAPVLRPQPCHVRPPGDGVPAIHTLLPHVLRV